MRRADLELGLDVQRLLNSTIRPLLNIDAGDIEIASVEDGHVRLELLGTCSRCCFRAACAQYTVVDRIVGELGDRAESVRVIGVPAPKLRTVPASPALSGETRGNV